MLKSLRIIFAVIAGTLAIYGLITDNSFKIMVYMQFFLGAMLLVIGLSELQEKRKLAAYFMFLVAGASFLWFIFNVL